MVIMTNTITTFNFLLLILAISIVSIQQIYATGCPTNFVSEHIKNAKAALQNGTTEEALNQLELAEEALGVAAQENE